MQSARTRIRHAAGVRLRAIAGRLGYQLVRRDYYSPLVDPRLLPLELWDTAAPMPGLDLDLDAQLEVIERELVPLLSGFNPPLARPADPRALHLHNPWFGPMDAHVTYALLRQLRPRRVLELGSGYSSLVIAQALRANAEDGARAQHEVIDPHPSNLLEAIADTIVLSKASAADAPEAAFTGLQEGDVLFIDTSHVVRPGGEVVRVVLELLPRLAPGVVVQIHDFFRPFEYPRVLYDVFDVHWQEQYLVQALLADSPRFRVLYANHALWRLRRERVTSLFPGLREDSAPSSLWLVRLPDGADGGAPSEQRHRLTQQP